MKVIQIKGGNGSGKTTIVKQMLEMSEDVVKLRALVLPNVQQGSPIYATWFRDLGWIALGEYDIDKAMGGVDRSLGTIADIKHALVLAVEHGLESDAFGVVFEGMMISTIKSTFYDCLLGLERKYRIEPLFVILETTPHGCLRRIEARGTKRRNLKFANIANKAAMVVGHALTYDQKYVRWIDVESTELEAMLPTFLEEVGDDELLGLLCGGICGWE